jgi:hypothetical protein
MDCISTLQSCRQPQTEHTVQALRGFLPDREDIGVSWAFCPRGNRWMGIPMMSISHSDLMPIRSERSDAGLSQCETVIGIRQEFCCFSLS